jgi:hypothetical protein
LAVDVRFGSLADILAINRDGCFTPNSGHFARRAACPLCAIADIAPLASNN